MLKKWLRKVIWEIIREDDIQRTIHNAVRYEFNDLRDTWLRNTINIYNPSVLRAVKKVVGDLADREEMRFSNTEEFLDRVIERIKRKQVS